MILVKNLSLCFARGGGGGGWGYRIFLEVYLESLCPT